MRCRVQGCDRSHHGRGWCRAHWDRVRRTGDAGVGRPLRTAADAPGYSALHRRLAIVRGPASAQPCAGCARPARVWSYDGADPDERTDGFRYSLDLARYRPLCRSCHRRATGPLDVDRAVRLYRAGASSRGIAALLDVSPSTVLRALRAHNVPIRNRGRRTR